MARIAPPRLAGLQHKAALCFSRRMNGFSSSVTRKVRCLDGVASSATARAGRDRYRERFASLLLMDRQHAAAHVLRSQPYHIRAPLSRMKQQLQCESRLSAYRIMRLERCDVLLRPGSESLTDLRAAAKGHSSLKHPLAKKSTFNPSSTARRALVVVPLSKPQRGSRASRRLAPHAGPKVRLALTSKGFKALQIVPTPHSYSSAWSRPWRSDRQLSVSRQNQAGQAARIAYPCAWLADLEKVIRASGSRFSTR